MRISNFIRQRAMVFIFSAFLAALCSPAVLEAYVTENVIVVVLCGVRGSEALLDPTHQYIPNIWNNLKPLGVTNAGMQTFADPATIPGHFAILTGSWSEIGNIGFTTDQYRVHKPTLFEYFLKGLNLPAGEAYGVIAFENKLDKEDHSLHPLYGAQYKASLIALSPPIDNADEQTRDAIYNIMDTRHPSLLVATFKAADYLAHKGNWDGYVNAIKTQDQIIYETWNKIENDPFYAGKTTLFVIGDHGRHDDANGGFQSHGDILSDGDRYVIFQAIGPDFKKNLVLNTTRKLIDLLPTIGELTGTATPLADGRIMWELFNNVYTSDKLGKYNETYPSIAAYNNKSNVVYQKTPLLLSEGSEQIMYYSLVNGQKANNGKLSGEFLISDHPSIAASTSGLHMVYIGWIPADGTYTNNYDWQHIYYLNSSDYGSSWVGPVRISPAKPFWIQGLAIDAEGATVAAAWAYDKNFLLIKTSVDGGSSWTENNIQTIFPRAPEVAIEKTAAYVVFYDAERYAADGGNRDIYLTKSADAGTTWSTRIRLTSDAANDVNPDMAVSGDTVHIVWENNTSGIWQVCYVKSSDGGSTWGDITTLTNSPVGAQRPRIEAIGGKVMVVWEDYRNGKSELMMKKSINGGITWSNEFKPINNAGWIRNTGLSTDGTKFHIVWEDNNKGTWQISGMQLP